MSKIFRATTALAMLAASLPALGASATATRSWQYKPESNAGLAVRNLIGDVRIERGSQPGFHVTARTTIEAESQAEAERLVKLVDFRTADVGVGSRFDVRLLRDLAEGREIGDTTTLADTSIMQVISAQVR